MTKRNQPYKGGVDYAEKGDQKAEWYSARRILQYGRNSRRIISAGDNEKEIP